MRLCRYGLTKIGIVVKGLRQRRGIGEDIMNGPLLAFRALQHPTWGSEMRKVHQSIVNEPFRPGAVKRGSDVHDIYIRVDRCQFRQLNIRGTESISLAT